MVSSAGWMLNDDALWHFHEIERKAVATAAGISIRDIAGDRRWSPKYDCRQFIMIEAFVELRSNIHNATKVQNFPDDSKVSTLNSQHAVTVRSAQLLTGKASAFKVTDDIPTLNSRHSSQVELPVPILKCLTDRCIDA